MTIEITRPELQALIQQCLQSGSFQDVQELILDALRSYHAGELSGADLVAAMQSSPYKELDIEPRRDRLPVRDLPS